MAMEKIPISVLLLLLKEEFVMLWELIVFLVDRIILMQQ